MKIYRAGQKHQKGFTFPELAIGATVILAFLVGAFVLGGSFLGAPGKSLSASEGQNLVQGLVSYKNIAGDYSAATVAVLVAGGYIEGYTDGVGENQYNRNFSIASAASGANATLTYATPDQPSCSRFTTLMDQDVNVSTVGCTAGVATVTIQ